MHFGWRELPACVIAAERGVSVYASEVLDCWYKYNGMVITGYRYNEDQTFFFFFPPPIQNALIILEAFFLSFCMNNQESNISELENRVKQVIMINFCKYFFNIFYKY